MSNIVSLAGAHSLNLLRKLYLFVCLLFVYERQNTFMKFFPSILLLQQMFRARGDRKDFVEMYFSFTDE